MDSCFLPLVCSNIIGLAIWNAKNLGFWLDPLVLVPFLVFAIGVSHGIQQVNQITKEVIEDSHEFAARASFSRLLVPVQWH